MADVPLEDEDELQVALEDGVVSTALGHAISLAQLYGMKRETFLKVADGLWSIAAAAINARMRGNDVTTMTVDSNPCTPEDERVVISTTKKEETKS